VPRDAGGAFDTDQECGRASCLNPAHARGDGWSSITQDQALPPATFALAFDPAVINPCAASSVRLPISRNTWLAPLRAQVIGTSVNARLQRADLREKVLELNLSPSEIGTQSSGMKVFEMLFERFER
jgi:hypothetical protein